MISACEICDGMTYEELDRRDDMTILVNGWLMIQVGSGPEPGWTYTVGLSESFNHPELLCADLPDEPDVQQFLVHHLASRVADEGTIDAAVLARLGVELVPVHPDWFATGMVGAWEHRYDRTPDAGEILQVVAGRRWFLDGDTSSRRRLDQPITAAG